VVHRSGGPPGTRRRCATLTLYAGKKKKSSERAMEPKHSFNLALNMTEHESKVKLIQAGTYPLLGNGYRVSGSVC
jgi:hypothetical protein